MSFLSNTQIEAFQISAGVTSANDEFTEKLPAGLNEALKEALAEEQKEANKTLAKEMVSILKKSKDIRSTLVNEIRNIRSSEKKVSARLKEYTRAEAYAMEKSNFLPLLCLLGKVPENTEGTKIPEDWQPAKTE